VGEKKNSAKSPSNGGKTDRDGKGRFAAGNKGGGRKRLPQDVKEMFKAATSDAAKLLIDTMNNQEMDIKLRVDCAERVIERVYGKPTQPIDGNFDGKIMFTLAEGLKEYAE
jgi:hypothetical protein